jgi:hypothetical protein
MTTLWAQTLTPAEILRRAGDMRQLAGVEPYDLVDGSQRGSRGVRLYNAAGLDFDVSAERGLSLIRVAFRGIPLAWTSPVGVMHPAYQESSPLGWLRTWPGGFLTPCGLTQVGAPAEDNGVQLGIHGRVAHLPAFNLRWGSEWQDKDYLIWVEGTLHETVAFGENLRLHRRIWTRLDEPRLWIEDRVENLGFEPAPLMFLQHINLGFPLVSNTTRLVLPEHTTTARDAVAAPGLDACLQFEDPTPRYQEQVFYHDLKADSQGQVEVRLENPAFNAGRGLGLYLRYALSEYPLLVEWKMMGEGMYVVGLEPANCHVEGRVKERQRGTLQMLEPNTSRAFRIEIGFSG